jgi:thymidylate synthase
MRIYQELLRHVLAEGEPHDDDRTGVGTLSVFGYMLRHPMSEGFPLLTTKKVPLRWVFEEIMWMMRGETDETKLREMGVDIWKEWATPEQTARFGRQPGDLGPVYGWLWRHFGSDYALHQQIKDVQPHAGGVDQLRRLLTDLVHNPGSRRHIVTGWDPLECDRVALPPCHTLWQMKVHPARHSPACDAAETTQCICGARKGMSLELYMRSCDSFLGLPFNMAQYGLVLMLLCWATDRVPRDLVVTFGDLHIYKNHCEQAEMQLGRDPRPLPSVLIKRRPEPLLPLESILALRWEDLMLVGYDPHGKIPAPVAV